MRMSLLQTYPTVDKHPEQTQAVAGVAEELTTADAVIVATSVDCTPDRNPFHVYLARLANNSRPTMAEALERIARIASGGALEATAFPWHLLRYQHVTAVRTALTECFSERTGKPLGPATVNKALSALRGVLREAWRLGLMNAEDLARATDFAPVRGSTVLRGRALASHEVAALFHVCSQDQTAAGPRDAVILALGVAAGLRRAEIAGLDLADLDLGRELIRVHGKGRKVREVPVKNGSLDALWAWLTCRGSQPGALVCPVRKGGRVELRRLAPQSILRVCEKRAQEAGIKEFAAHDLRRTYISALLDQGVDLSVASELAGHSSPTTTKRYDRRGERARHAAAETIVVPYVWRGETSSRPRQDTGRSLILDPPLGIGPVVWPPPTVVSPRRESSPSTGFWPRLQTGKNFGNLHDLPAILDEDVPVLWR